MDNVSGIPCSNAGSLYSQRVASWRRAIAFGKSPYTLLVDMSTNGDSGHQARAASSRFKVPIALVSKSSTGMAADRPDRIGDRGSIPHVEAMVLESRDRLLQPLLVPPGVAGWSQEHRTLIVVDPVDGNAAGREVLAQGGADETRRSGYERG